MIKIMQPTMVLNEDICKENIALMAARAKAAGVIFRPHFKTHQSKEVGEWFRNAGVDRITVSSLDMALKFAEWGWKDITVAFPMNYLEYEKINSLASRIRLNILLVHTEAAEKLLTYLQFPVGVYVGVDVGYHRDGISVTDYTTIDRMLDMVNSDNKLEFEGFLTHAGQTYHAHGPEEILSIHQGCLEMLSRLKEHYITRFPFLKISYGDTPSCSLAEGFGCVDEIRPGNFVFYDLTQMMVGSCTWNRIAIAVKCPVVDINRHRNEAVIYGGGVHFSKDRIDRPGQEPLYGLVAENRGDYWGSMVPDVELVSLSQEHGLLHCPASFLDNLYVGDILTVLPVHACMTADLLKTYHMGNDRKARHI